MQDNGPVAYASKAMNETQRRYAQIENELLAIVFGFKRFHQYVYGKTIVIKSDHRPLVYNYVLKNVETSIKQVSNVHII